MQHRVWDRIWCNAQRFEQPDVHLHDLLRSGRYAHVHEEPVEFAAPSIAETNALRRSALPCNKAAFRQPLEIDGDVPSATASAQLFAHLVDRAPAHLQATRKHEQFINLRMPFQQICCNRLRRPTYVCLRVRIAQRVQGWQCVYHVANGAQLYDKDARRIGQSQAIHFDGA